jgi:hypothetical protein
MLVLKTASKSFDPCFDSRMRKSSKSQEIVMLVKIRRRQVRIKRRQGGKGEVMMVGCRLKNWRGSATSNAGTPVSAAGKSRGFKLEERKRIKRMEVSVGHAHFLQTNLPTKEKERGRG